jgi:hypothetical protein
VGNRGINALYNVEIRSVEQVSLDRGNIRLRLRGIRWIGEWKQPQCGKGRSSRNEDDEIVRVYSLVLI